MEGIDRESTIDAWLKKHCAMYTGATRHPFILGIRDGSVDLSSFKRWLKSENITSGLVYLNKDIREGRYMKLMSYKMQGQDYIFVRAFVPFAANVLVKAWKESDDGSDMYVILGGMAALNDEIAWFKREASKWGVVLDSVVPQKTNLDYCRFLEHLMSSDVDYTRAITAFWAIEAVYQESFAHCLEEGSKTPEELRETCQRWGNEGFGQYCQDLKIIANRRLDKASDDVLGKTEVSLLRILEHEVEFWNMSREGRTV